MLNDLNKAVLKRANDNLALMFPKMKIKPIKLYEIEKVYRRNVLGITADIKTRKGEKYGYLTGILYFAPSNISGIELCPKKSAGCASACLFTAGRGAFASITRQRIIKTLAYHFDKKRFHETVKKSIKTLVTKAKNKSMTPVVRLNGTSDIPWELNSDIIQSFPLIQFYDYSKIARRFEFTIPSNYHLTFSLSESNEADALKVLARGGNVAAVFLKDLPSSLFGYSVTNGDETDLRFLDQKGTIVGLKAKGKARKDTSGFVRDIAMKQAA